MNNYEKHAWQEFKAAGWLDDEGKFKDDMQKDICDHVIKLLGVFASEGHSGTSAPYAVNLFQKLAMFEPIAPLTGEDWEWVEICDASTDGVSVFQNKRASHVFKQSDRFNGQAYDIHGKVFWEWYTDPETGEKHESYYTSSESVIPIEFPYVPTREYIYKESEAE